MKNAKEYSRLTSFKLSFEAAEQPHAAKTEPSRFRSRAYTADRPKQERMTFSKTEQTCLNNCNLQAGLSSRWFL